MSEKKITNPETQAEKKTENKKNKGRFHRGIYSVGITALVLVGIIAFNVLVSALSNRFMLEYDMTIDKVKTISEENLRYIKEVDTEIDVIMCAEAEDYYTQGMNYYGQNLYGLVEDYGQYYKQTVELVKKYNSYNSKINVTFIDTQDSEFTDIAQKYSDEVIGYGDIIVSAEINGSTRYKIIGFADIYELYEDTSYGELYKTVLVQGNNIETALTSAITYVTNDREKKVAFLTGHSSEDFSTEYRKMLEINNYEVDVIDDKAITKLDTDYSALFIVGPNRDFLESELSVIADYLDNNEKYGTSLVFFADCTAPYLPNFYGFLEEWGIEVSEGKLFQTDVYNCIPYSPTTFYSQVVSADSAMSNGVADCVTGYNIPMNPAFSADGNIKVSKVVATYDTVVNAPVNVSDNWKGYDDYEQDSYSTVIDSHRTAYDSKSNLLENHVFAFSSVEFIYSEYYSNYSSSVGNKKLALKVAERAVGAEDTGISFVTRQITTEGFTTPVTEANANAVLIIFVIAMPVLLIIAGVIVYIRRRIS